MSDTPADASASPAPSTTATWREWLEGARPHTWANAVSPVLAGTAAAVYDGGASWWRAVLALIVAMALIIGVNFANDYSDGIRGTDDDRTGPLR
ncbi:MAG: 1,4-dihydroxy-2-naphthoate polyprenyltransferase, partial [Corynebacterium nuruki]|nr:1,4-dihydroxy-2-naphthoate polyprenyltransferase [Corynebacterium nuruki]